MHWAEAVARRVLSRKREIYTCAAGVTPSGPMHLGHLREVLTSDFVARCLKSMGKKVRFIYSWDDFDRFRKIPRGVPEDMEKYIGMPVVKVPDPFGCHDSYAEHFESGFEEFLAKIGVKPEFLRQGRLYPSCTYAEEIKKALDNREIIAGILNKYRREPLPENWYPVRIYCEKCWKDTTEIKEHNGYILKYTCLCGFSGETDFRKNGNVKLVWRVDWPMRWFREKVDFEPGGKEHSTPGGSHTTAVEISKEVYDYEPPVYLMYDFIIVRGRGGKMSSSVGNVISPEEVLEIFLPEIIRFLFAKTKPGKEFSISFDEEVIKIYEEFYRVERIYFGAENTPEKKKGHFSRVYELSMPFGVPEHLPVQPSFRLASVLVQILGTENTARVLGRDVKNEFDRKRVEAVVKRAKVWIEKHAPERFRIKPPEKLDVDENQKTALKVFCEILEENPDEERLSESLRKVPEDAGMPANEFFSLVYNALLGKPYGPRLSRLVALIGPLEVKKRIEKLIE
ncbi:MAG: lysine--tRNA ligase [Candidatus Micrarchaeota archaeon]|nr:lysine--tRNA ligase [Candidatus Micrarchaeota archaeon]